MLIYSVSEIPFSLPGSFLTITQAKNQAGKLLYRTCSGRAVNRKGSADRAADFFEIALVQAGKEIPYTWTAQPHCLDLLGEGDSGATIVFLDKDTLMFDARRVDLRLISVKPFAEVISPSPDQLHLTDYLARGIHQLRAAPGTRLTWTSLSLPSEQVNRIVSSPLMVDFSGRDGAQGVIRFSRHECRWEDHLPDFTETLEQRADQYFKWASKMPIVPVDYAPTAELAWFLLWNVQVAMDGALTRPAVYMSKSTMNAIFAWDNCFNTLAVAGADPKLAWDQLLLFFDHQNDLGMIPDMITDLEPIYCFTKPPIQGWTIRKLVLQYGLKESLPYLEQIYKPLSRLTEWWYTQRDYDQDGMPQYHHGNDSGWDNATVFDQGYPTEGADLAAHLVIQCETLAFIANALGKDKASARWFERAQRQLSDLVTKGVHQKRFFSPLNGRNNAEPNQSLLNYIPLELGGRLPADMLENLVADLEPGGAFFTNWGLATESPHSPKYEANGYWRGPIWAPSTYLIFDGLVDAGKIVLAQAVARRFCDLCVHDPGFWENFDALSGKGQCCPGYSWTASVFILLAQWLETMSGS